MSVNSKMTALADEVRDLSGTTGKLSIDTMATKVGDANDEIAEQVELLAQAVSALEGKAAGSGGVTLPTLTNPGSASDLLSGKELIDGSGNVVTGTIATKSASNLTASGATVTVPAGYYASQATKSVSTATQATPTVSINTSGKITASATQTAGYVSAGTKTGTKQLTTQAAKTITPSTSSQTAVAKNVYTTGVVTVAAIPSNYEDVTTETTTYTSALTELEEVINTLPEAGGGGGSIATCTVTITTSGVYLNIAAATVVNADTGLIEIKTYPYESSSATFENVICGSHITVYPSGSGIAYSLSDNMQLVGGYMAYILSAPSTAGASGSVNFYSNL